MSADEEEKTVRITTDAERDQEIRAAAWELVDRFTGPEPAHPESQATWRRDREYVRETIRDALGFPGLGPRVLKRTRDRTVDPDLQPERDDDHVRGPSRGRGHAL